MYSLDSTLVTVIVIVTSSTLLCVRSVYRHIVYL